MTSEGLPPGIRRRTSGTTEWRAEISHDPITGRRREISGSVPGTSRTALREAVRQRNAALAAAERGETVEGGRMTVGRFWQEEFLPYVRPGVREATFERYRGLGVRWIMPTIGDLQLRQVGEAAVVKVWRQALDEGRSNATAQKIHRVLSSCLQLAVERHKIVRNPARVRSARPPSPSGKRIDPPSDDEVAALIRAAEGTPYHPAVVLGATSGLRESEVLGLRWRDVDLDGVVGSPDGAPIRQGVAFLPPKTAKSARTVAIPTSVVTVLRRHRVAQSERRLAAGEGWQSTDLVVDRGDGGPVHPVSYGQWFRRTRDRLGIRARLHDLRHYFASALLARNVHPKVASEMLGHSTVGFTLTVYSHLIAGMGRAGCHGDRPRRSPRL